MAGEGQMLRAARLEKAWSLTDTEEVTKIQVRYIQALEDEEYEILPGTTYVKGYLRTYAKQLGLDSDEIMEIYKSSMTPEPEAVLEIPHIPIKTRPLWIRPAIVGMIAVVMIGLIIGVVNWSHPKEQLQTTQDITPPLPSAPSKTESTTPSINSPVVSNSANAVAATQDGLTAQLVFTQPCWIVVQVDGQPSFQGTFASGTSKEVKATSKIELVSVGNAGGLSVTLNGKALPSLGKAGQVLHNIVLNPDTLKSL